MPSPVLCTRDTSREQDNTTLPHPLEFADWRGSQALHMGPGWMRDSGYSGSIWLASGLGTPEKMIFKLRSKTGVDKLIMEKRKSN